MRPLITRLSILGEGVRIALQGMWANKVRATLTIMGVAVGVFVVVVIAATVHGINRGVTKSLETTGPTTFFVSRYPIVFERCDESSERCAWRANPPLRWSEVAALQRLPGAAEVGARLDWSAPAEWRGHTIPSAYIESYTGNWSTISVPDIRPGGRAFTDAENHAGARVVLLNTTLAERLFGAQEPLGASMTFKGVPFRVIGVYEETSNIFSGNRQPRAVMPIMALNRALHVPLMHMSLAVKPRPEVPRDEMVDEVIATLRTLRGLRPRQESTFAILTQDKLFAIYNKVFGTFFLVMIALSAVGLLVGGVGVIAIMLIAVTERTREIGVRKALGATRPFILWQFLIEAVTLTAAGAMAGLAVGWGATRILQAVTGIDASIPPGAVLAALVASAFTGVLFGMLPAIRAARLDPVEALRYE